MPMQSLLYAYLCIQNAYLDIDTERSHCVRRSVGWSVGWFAELAAV